MRLILVRHALPERVDPERSGDGTSADPPLTPHGRRQAERLPDGLRGEPVDAVYSSPMRRARQTATPLADERGLPPLLRPDLCEYDARAAGYLPIETMAGADPDTWERMRAGWLPAHVDAEEFGSRVVRAIEEIVAAHPGRATAVVFAHAGVINAYLASILSIPWPLPFPLDYAGITRVVCARGGLRKPRTVNEIGHVADLLAPAPAPG